eukprot:5871289-Pyramimonas_sp.AAC.1
MWSEAALSTWNAALVTTLGVMTAANMFLADAFELIANVIRVQTMMNALSQTRPVSVDSSHSRELPIVVIVTR